MTTTFKDAVSPLLATMGTLAVGAALLSAATTFLEPTARSHPRQDVCLLVEDNVGPKLVEVTDEDAWSAEMLCNPVIGGNHTLELAVGVLGVLALFYARDFLDRIAKTGRVQDPETIGLEVAPGWPVATATLRVR